MNSRLYAEHLSRVSRSFTFCIEQMRSPEKEMIGLAYILCRLADTIEDSKWLNIKEQENSFRAFIQLVRSPSRNADILKWQNSMPISIPDSEKKLITDSTVFFEDLHAMADPIRSHIQRCVVDMVNGMLYFTQHLKTKNGLRLRSIAETNQYCFFVAGIVGELLTLIMSKQIVGFNEDKENLLNSFHFGLYLQKINLLKDHLSDAQEGRYFFTDYNVVRASIEAHARRALQYLEAIPTTAREYRLFCAWSLYLGLASLRWIDKSFAKKKVTKIPRIETGFLIKKIERMIDSNIALRQEFEVYYPTQTENQPELDFQLKEISWIKEAYSGQLNKNQMINLGIFEKI